MRVPAQVHPGAQHLGAAAAAVGHRFPHAAHHVRTPLPAQPPVLGAVMLVTGLLRPTCSETMQAAAQHGADGHAASGVGRKWQLPVTVPDVRSPSWPRSPSCMERHAESEL